MFKLLQKFIILSGRLFLILMSCKIAHMYVRSYHITLLPACMWDNPQKDVQLHEGFCLPRCVIFHLIC